MTEFPQRLTKAFSDGEDQRYYLRRAEDELDGAQQAEHPRAVAAHYIMAERYLDRVYGAAGNDGDDD